MNSHLAESQGSLEGCETVLVYVFTLSLYTYSIFKGLRLTAGRRPNTGKKHSLSLSISLSLSRWLS